MNYKVKLVKRLFLDNSNERREFILDDPVVYFLEKEITLYHIPMVDTTLILRGGREFDINVVVQFEENESFIAYSTKGIEYWRSDQLEKIKEDYLRDGWKEMDK